MKRLVTAALISLITCTLLLWLTLTTTGLRFITQAAQLLTHKQFTVDSAQGRLIGPMKLQGLQLNNHHFDLKMQTVNIDWKPCQLLQGKLTIKYLYIQGVQLHLHAAKPTSSSNLLLKVMPQAVIVQCVTVHDTMLWSATDMPPMQIKQINLHGFFTQQQGQIQDWHAQLALMHWQPGYNLNADINLSLATQGQQQVGHLQVQALQGSWQNYPVNGSAIINFTPQQLSIKQMRLNIADAWLQCNGQFNHHWQLQWQLTIPNLQHLLPKGRGNIFNQGVLTGNRQTLQGHSQLLANNLQIGNYQLQQLQADIELKPQADTRIKLNAINFYHGNLAIRQLALQANGNTQAQQFRFALQTPTQKLALQGSGKLNQQAWQASLASGRWQTIGLSSQKLTIPITGLIAIDSSHHNLTLQYQLSTLPQTQLRGSFSLLNYQLGQSINPKQKITGLASLHLNQSQYLPLPYLISGSFDLMANISGTLATPVIQGQAKLLNAAVSLPQLGIHLQNVNLLAKGDPKGNIYIQAQAYSAGKLSVQGIIKPAANRLGGWQSDLRITGNQFLTYRSPEYQIYTSPNLHLTGLDKQFNLQGSITIPKADLATIEDKLKDQQQIIKPSDDVEYLDEKNITNPLKLTSQIRLLLGDQVRIDMHGLTGQLKGQLFIQENNSGTATGIGEIYIENGAYQAYGQRLAIREGRLVYHANPLSNPGLSIEAIKKVRLAPVSADRTNLFIENIDSLVGIRVRGTLLAPQAQLFADPANLTPADILSYLLFDKPSSEATNPQALLQLASSLTSGSGTSKLAHLKERLQHGIGLDELSIETNAATDFSSNNPNQTKPALALGKALSPRLYLRYSMGLLEPINTLTIRYLLSSQWVLQSSSSTNGSGIDLLYEIER